MLVIEMNPRVSRSSALASKATGFPIAKIAAKLAVGYTLDELRNDITRETPASFEPAIDYCVVKFPRWAFEKFPEADQTLTTQMKSVGEVMAIGRTFKEALQKAVRSLEQDRWGLTLDRPIADLEALRQKIRVPNPERCFALAEAYRRGLGTEELHALSGIDPWFLDGIREIVELEPLVTAAGLADLALLRRAKQMGFSDRRIGELTGSTEDEVRQTRLRAGLRPVYKMVDTCAAEFVAHTPYLYSTYEEEDEAPPTSREKVVILGSGPNRIGQGIEFDYACVHAAFALKESGVEAIMINCNPETVSTDYDTSDRLYFEPLTLEDVLNIVEREKPRGVIVQFGGQTPLKLVVPLQRAGVPILGTPPDAIDRAEDRKRFAALLEKLGLRQAPGATARSFDEAATIAANVGFPVLVRPSYVLGGRAMQIVYDGDDLRTYMTEAVRVSPEHPILVDKFLEDALEIDVDALSDGERVVVGGVMEHVEKAGRALGRLRLRAAPLLAGRRSGGHHQAPDARAGAGARRDRAPQHPVRHQERDGVRPRGESARLAHRALRVQGHRRPAGQARHQDHAGPVTGGSRLHRGARGRPHRHQGSGVPLHQVPRRGRAAGPGDEIHRRGDGHRPRLPQGLREGADRGGVAAAHLGQGLHLGEEPRQARGAGHRQAAGRDGLHPGGHRGHRQAAHAPGHDGGDGPQGGRGLPARTSWTS